MICLKTPIRNTRQSHSAGMLLTVCMVSTTVLQPAAPWLAVYCVAAHCQAAHPQHAAVAEVEWNARTGRFEVAMRINSFELEAELSAIHFKRVSVDRDDGLDSLIATYLEPRFRLRTASHSACRLHWVGMEVERSDLWIYFELLPVVPHGEADDSETGAPLAFSLEELRIHNELLMTTRPEQINLVNVVRNGVIQSSHHTLAAPEVLVQPTLSIQSRIPVRSAR